MIIFWGVSGAQLIFLIFLLYLLNFWYDGQIWLSVTKGFTKDKILVIDMTGIKSNQNETKCFKKIKNHNCTDGKTYLSLFESILILEDTAENVEVGTINLF